MISWALRMLKSSRKIFMHLLLTSHQLSIPQTTTGCSGSCMTLASLQMLLMQSRNFMKTQPQKSGCPSWGYTQNMTCWKRNYPRRHTLSLPLPPLYGTHSLMAPCRRTWLQTQLHPRSNPNGYPPGQYDQQRLTCRWPYKWNQHNLRP